MITVSIVSHGHGVMVDQLVHQLELYPQVSQIILTRNIPEPSKLRCGAKLKIIDNQSPAGFGANHNAAFKHCQNSFFCVINPDITFIHNSFADLIFCISENNADLGVPLVLDTDGKVEDSVRHYPTPFSLLVKGVGGSDGSYPVMVGHKPFCPEWAAGMFMLFRRRAFDEVGGFDETFFLYYEDVDICVRMHKAGQKIVVCPSATIVHNARRASRYHWRYLRWHLTSMVRFFCKHLGRLPRSKFDV
ncbi:MAG: glycosyltransferase family 2 protein [Thermodesulfobacteriota bacterium]|nr:glycosyltransferase family 2 protein [Thermodesulfobacteriota bacterium]